MGDAQKARVFFERGDVVAATENFEYAIEIYVTGLGFDPDNLDGHRSLREIGLLRKAKGGKDLGMFDKMKLGPKRGDDAKNALNAARLLAYDPGNTDRMLQFNGHARNAGMTCSADWIQKTLDRATGRS